MASIFHLIPDTIYLHLAHTGIDALLFFHCYFSFFFRLGLLGVKVSLQLVSLQ